MIGTGFLCFEKFFSMSTDAMTEPTAFLDLAADIVSAFVSNNAARAAELPDLIRSVHSTLVALTAPAEDAQKQGAPVPAVPVKKSVGDEHITCLEDGKTFKSLKRHLQAEHGLTPDQYREKWGLPRHYPMVAPHYAAARSTLAKAAGLGNRRGKGAAAEAPEPQAAAPEPAAEPPAKRRGRPARKAA